MVNYDEVPGVRTPDEVHANEEEYIKLIIGYEKEIKNIREAIKNTKNEYDLRGVDTKFVNKALKSIQRDIKKEPTTARYEDEIKTRIMNNDSVMNMLRDFIQG